MSGALQRTQGHLIPYAIVPACTWTRVCTLVVQGRQLGARGSNGCAPVFMRLGRPARPLVLRGRQWAQWPGVASSSSTLNPVGVQAALDLSCKCCIAVSWRPAIARSMETFRQGITPQVAWWCEGGAALLQVHGSVEAYVPEAGKWLPIAGIAHARSSMALGVL